MKTICKMFVATCGALALGLLFVPQAGAQCGAYKAFAKPTSWQRQTGQPRLLLAGFPEDAATVTDNSIIGFWHVKFVSEGSKGIPDGTEVDAGYSQWHSDGTEIMNSGAHSPITSSFCLGVWKKLGDLKYQLNHYAIAWDATGTSLIGPANIRENITLDPDGLHFTGTFTIDQYTETGTSLAHVQGNVTGSKIDVETLPQSVF